MMMLVQIAAAALLLLGSGLIFYALVRLDREPETRSAAERPLTSTAAAERKLPWAA